MTARIWVSEIQFSDDSNIAIDKNDIVVLVGPNNAGKSASLKKARPSASMYPDSSYAGA